MKNASTDLFSIQKASSLQELLGIQRLRYEVYSSEMGISLPAMDHEQRQLVESLDDSAAHIYALAGETIVGALRINQNQVPKSLEGLLETKTLPRPFCYCSRLYVQKEWRGGSIFARLARASFDEFSRLNAAVAICHCYPHLQKLYERMGFRVYGKPFVQPGLDSLGWQRAMKCVLAQEDVLQSA